MCWRLSWLGDASNKVAQVHFYPWSCIGIRWCSHICLGVDPFPITSTLCFLLIGTGIGMTRVLHVPQRQIFKMFQLGGLLSMLIFLNKLSRAWYLRQEMSYSTNFCDAHQSVGMIYFSILFTFGTCVGGFLGLVMHPTRWPRFTSILGAVLVLGGAVTSALVDPFPITSTLLFLLIGTGIGMTRVTRDTGIYGSNVYNAHGFEFAQKNKEPSGPSPHSILFLSFPLCLDN
nr:hypothetical protein Iba_chr14dCG15970 [Ipomoea batatas]